MIEDTHSRRKYIEYLWRKFAFQLESLWNTGSNRQTQVFLFGSADERPMTYDELIQVVGVEVVSVICSHVITLFPDSYSIRRLSFAERRVSLDTLAEAAHAAYMNERRMRNLRTSAQFDDYTSIPEAFKMGYRLFVAEALDRYEQMLNDGDDTRVLLSR